MEKELWISADGKVMLGEQALPRCRVLSMEQKNDSLTNVRVEFEIEVEELDVQFRAIVPK